MTRYDVTTESMEDIHKIMSFYKTLLFSFFVFIGLMLTMPPVISLIWGFGILLYPPLLLLWNWRKINV
jgi:hypothetical protein